MAIFVPLEVGEPVAERCVDDAGTRIGPEGSTRQIGPY
jgi:hypothetical protein